MFKSGISKKAVYYPIIMLIAMWFFYVLQLFGIFDNCFGAIIPLLPEGLLGVIFSPLLHGNIEHILSNSVPILALMFLLYQFYPRIANRIFIIGWIVTGLLVWVLPPIDIFTGEYQYTCTIGASGVVYVLAFFLFLSGVLKGELRLITVSLVVVLYYGSLIWGIFPQELFGDLQEPSRISWQAHAAGAIVGIALAICYRKSGEKKKKFIWEFPNYYSEKDDKLWNDYKENNPEDFLELPYKKKEDFWEHLDEIRKK